MAKAKSVTAADLAREMDLPPKRVRAILRTLGYQHDGRWAFPVGEKAAIKAAIKESRRRPKAKAVAAPKKQAAKRPRREHALADVEHVGLMN